MTDALETPVDPTTTADTDTRAAAIKAGEQALREAGLLDADPTADETPAAAEAPAKSDEPATEEEPKRGPDGKFLPKGAKDEKEEPSPAEADAKKEDPTKLAVVLRARQHAQRVREAGEAEARAIREQAQRELEEARRMKAELEPYQRAAAAFRKNPQEGIRELTRATSLPTREIVDGLVQEGAPDPVRDMQRQLQEALQEISALKGGLKERDEHTKRAEAQRHVQQETTQFLSHVAGDGEKYKLLNAVYEDDVPALLERANRVQAEYFQRTGRYASREDVAEYLELLEQERAARYTKVTAPQAAEQKTQPGGRANGHSPISAAASAQRATGPVTPEQMTDEERRAAAIKAGEQALREALRAGAR